MKLLRLAISRAKIDALSEDKDGIVSMLDILEAIVQYLITDEAEKSNDKDSEMTCYRKVAIVVDILLKGLKFDILE